MTVVWALIGLAAVIILSGVLIYNGLVRKNNLVKEGWAGVETQLKRRADLIPNLVATVKGYAAHERATFEEVTENRARSLGTAGVAERAEAEQALTRSIGRLMAVAENYPELKASENFLSLQNDLSTVENDIQLARRYYNATVRDLNIAIQSFPANLVAGGFGFKPAEFFEIENAVDRRAPSVSLDQGTASA
jgi:LemA protein